jgi:hypothetical protein
MTLAVPGATGFVALAQRAAIGMTVRPVGGTSIARPSDQIFMAHTGCFVVQCFP